METPHALALNRANWDERTPIHLGPRGYDLAPHRAGRGRLDALVEAELGPVAGLRVLHLQSHLGDDSIALAQRGAAEVLGVDFSPAAVAAATRLAAECGAAAVCFVEADALRAPDALPAEAGRFDLVFTSWGTVCWLPDIGAWARSVAFFLRPGGALHFADAHPLIRCFDAPGGTLDAAGRPGLAIPYFDRAPQVFDDPSDYMDEAAVLANSRTVEWMHGVGDILGALRAAGLRLDWLREHPRLAWRMFPHLVRDAGGMWTWPGQPWLPLALSLRAVREG
jgi:SAM-dependent methyltransferase